MLLVFVVEKDDFSQIYAVQNQVLVVTKVIFLFTNGKVYRNKNWQMSEVKLRTCSNKENEMIYFLLYFPLLIFSFSYNLRNVTHTLLDTRTSGVLSSQEIYTLHDIQVKGSQRLFL